MEKITLGFCMYKKSNFEALWWLRLCCFVIHFKQILNPKSSRNEKRIHLKWSEIYTTQPSITSTYVQFSEDDPPQPIETRRNSKLEFKKQKNLCCDLKRTK